MSLSIVLFPLFFCGVWYRVTFLPCLGMSSPFEKLLGEWVQALGATISGIIWVGKRYFWLVNSCLEDHQPIITNARLVHPNDPRSHCAQSLHPFSLGQFLNWEVYKIQITKLSKHNLFSGLSSPRCQPLHWRWAVWPRYVSLLSFGKD